MAISTHSFSFAQLGEFLDEIGIKNKLVIGIQPKSPKLGQGLSQEVKEAKDKLKQMLVEIINISQNSPPLRGGDRGG